MMYKNYVHYYYYKLVRILKVKEFTLDLWKPSIRNQLEFQESISELCEFKEEARKLGRKGKGIIQNKEYVEIED